MRLQGSEQVTIRCTKVPGIADRFEDVRLFVPHTEARALSALYALGAPIDERSDTEDGVLIRAHLPHREVRRFAAYLVAESHPAAAVDA